MEYVDFNNPKIPIGKRKQAYVRWAVSQGTPLWKAKRLANKKFGFERKGRWIARIGNACDMDLPSMRSYSWRDAAMDAGCPDPRKCQSIIIVCDSTYAAFDICEGFDILPNSWQNFERSLPTWQNCEEWAKQNGYKVTPINWICP